MSLEKVSTTEDATLPSGTQNAEKIQTKLTSSKLASKHKMKTAELLEKLVALDYLEIKENKHHLTEAGKRVGGEFKFGKHGPYFIWLEDMILEK